MLDEEAFGSTFVGLMVLEPLKVGWRCSGDKTLNGLQTLRHDDHVWSLTCHGILDEDLDALAKVMKYIACMMA